MDRADVLPGQKLYFCELQEARTIAVGIQELWDEVNARLKKLRSAQQVVAEDAKIRSGTPVRRGTRVPVYDVAGLLEEETPMDELKDLYPRLSEEQFRLASLYAIPGLSVVGRSGDHCPNRTESPCRRNNSERPP